MTTTANPELRCIQALMASATGDEKHDISAYSTLDVEWVRYDMTRPSSSPLKASTSGSYDFSTGNGIGLILLSAYLWAS